MSRCQIFTVLLLLVGAVTGLPDHLYCCSPESGTFQSISSEESNCWQVEPNNTKPIRLKCLSYVVLPEEMLNLTITETGQVLFIDPQLSRPVEIEHGKICYGNETNLYEDEVVTKSVVICKDLDESQDILNYCILVSGFFFLITSVVYAALPEVRDLLGRSIINFSGSMSIGCAILSGSNLVSYTGMTQCAILGYLIYFFVITSFFWTNAMCLQILLKLRQPTVNKYSWKLFAWYALYAWGCPTVLTLCIAIVNFYYGDHYVCWFYDTKQRWYYMYSVILMVIFVNVCIFVYTFLHLRWNPPGHVKVLQYESSITLRALIILGLTWIFEIISSALQNHIIGVINQVVHALQGPLIFLVLVVLRQRVRNALTRRLLTCLAGREEGYLVVTEDEETAGIQRTIDIIMNDRSYEE